jgi:hypothetical protein
MLLICIQYFDDLQISKQKQVQKDSSSMGTIAILGMVFLPGTFVAVSWSASPSGSFPDPKYHAFANVAGYFFDAGIQLGRWWCSICEGGVQILFGYGYTPDISSACSMGVPYAIATAIKA